MRMYDIIEKKRLGQALDGREIEYFIRGFSAGEIPDYQAAALLMAVCINGMNDDETIALTLSMASSGDTVDLSGLENTVDKHSTGGVGDKATLIVAPLVAALGGTVAKMSGRGLGHTGGTIDKLESIPGFRTGLSRDEFFDFAKKNGLCIASQSGNLDPADKKLYALRDVTATVASVPLIVSSIMSKKLAAGAKSIVLDVTVGSGAFISGYGEAKLLAEKMVGIGKSAGRNIAAVMTDMDAPLGKAVGNSLEVCEAISVLRGEGPDDLRQVCLALASEMVVLFSGKAPEDCRGMCEKALRDGSAYEKFIKMTEMQGGDVSYIEHPEKFIRAEYTGEVKAPQSGYISKMNTEELGEVSVTLGAGREKKDDRIDYSAGFEVLAKPGDYVKRGDTLALLYTNNAAVLSDCTVRYLSALTFSDEKPEARAHVLGIIR